MVSGRPVQVKVDVRVHSLAGQIIVRSGAMIFRIVEEILDSRDSLHEGGEFR